MKKPWIEVSFSVKNETHGRDGDNYVVMLFSFERMKSNDVVMMDGDVIESILFTYAHNTHVHICT